MAFYVFEGIDGCGKSTAARAFCDRIKNVNPVATVEPYTPWARGEVRRNQVPLAVLFAFLYDRAMHQQEVLLPAQQCGDIVVSDRYMHSTIAYQGYLLRDVIPNAVDTLIQLHQQLFVIPDMTFILDVPVDVAMQRIAKRNRATDAFEKRDVLTEVRNNYIYLARKMDNIIILDGTEPTEMICQTALEILGMTP
jgi:dTMP kinase